MSRKPDLTSRGAQKRAERERAVGLDPEDEAARWLDENDPKPPPALPKSLTKSKTLHQWRERQKRSVSFGFDDGDEALLARGIACDAA